MIAKWMQHPGRRSWLGQHTTARVFVLSQLSARRQGRVFDFHLLYPCWL